MMRPSPVREEAISIGDPIPFRASPTSAPEAALPAVCPVPSPVARRTRRRGVRWVAGSFLFCPCHLPITLTVLAGLLGGTTLGAALHHNPLAAAGIITTVWAAGTWRGLRLVCAARTCTTCVIMA